MPILTDDEFKKEIFDFIINNGIKETSFGKKANRDSRFCYDLQRGRRFGEKIKARVLEFMKSQHPPHASGKRIIRNQRLRRGGGDVVLCDSISNYFSSHYFFNRGVD